MKQSRDWESCLEQSNNGVIMPQKTWKDNEWELLLKVGKLREMGQNSKQISKRLGLPRKEVVKQLSIWARKKHWLRARGELDI